MLKKWYAKLLVLLAVVCAVAAAHPAAQAEAIPEETAQTQTEQTEETAEMSEAALPNYILKLGYCGAEGNGSNLRWELESNGTLSISGSGAMKNYSETDESMRVPWYLYRKQIKSLMIEPGLTEIGNYAFKDCTGLTSITFPTSLTSIGGYAFKGCTGLTSITFLDGLTSIGRSAFSGCTSLTSITFPTSLTSIGAYAFSGCTRLTSVTLPAGLTSIGDCAFYGCTGLTSLIFPDGLTSIGEHTFQGCTGLTSITLPASLTSIGRSVFNGCTGLTSVTFQEGLTSIGEATFSRCTGLTSLALPAGLTSIDSSAFSLCRGLTSVSFPDSLTSIGAGAFSDCSSLTSIVLPDGLKSIGNVAFQYCSGLTSVTFPDGLTSIGERVFSDCTGLTSITFPTALTSIGDAAFYNCSGLTKLTLPASVTNIGPYGLYFGTDSGAEIYFAGNAPTVTAATRSSPSFSPSAALFFEPGKTGWVNGRCYSPSTGTWNGYKIFPANEELEGVRDYGICGANQSETNFLIWKLYEGGRLSISGNGAMEDYTYSTPWARYYTSIYTVTVEAGVTSIGARSFYYNYGYGKLAAIELPDSLTSIGSSAFKGCTGLTSLTLPDGLTSIGSSAFSGCTGLTSLTLPAGLTSIGEAAFRYCRGLTSVTFSDGLTSIDWGTGAFGDCTGLTGIIFPDSLVSIGSSAFSGCTGLTSVTFPASLTSIGGSAFYGCTGLTNLTLPDGLSTLGSSAFSGCSGFKGCTLELPAGLERVEEEAFYLCGFSKITVPASVTYVGPYSLYFGTNGGANIYFSGNAPAVTAANESKPSFSTDSSLFFEQGKTGWDDSSSYVPSIGKWNGYKLFPANEGFEGVLAHGTCGADQGGTNLQWKLYKDGRFSISGNGAMADYSAEKPTPWKGYSDSICTVTIEADVTSIGAYSFYNYKKLTAITLPDSLTSIGGSAFGGCTGLIGITFPDSLASIGSSAFSGCTGLTGIIFPDSLASIGSSAFSGCTGLTSVTFPASLTSIGDSAFYGCTGLTNLTLPDGLSTLGSSAFSGCSGFKGCTLELPAGLERVEEEAFYLCGFSKITVPASVTYVGPYGLYCGTNDGTNIYFSGNAPTVTAANESKPSFSTDSSLFFEQGKTGWTDSSYVSSTGKWNGYKLFPANEGFEGVLAHGTCGADQGGTNLQWKLYKDGRFSISGSGAMADYSAEKPTPWKGYSDSICTVTVEADVTSIGAYSFYNYKKLTAITLPDSLANIGSSAFGGCTGLIGITFPDSLASIGSSAFSGCTGLTSVTFPASLTSIGDSAFNDCTGLTSLTLPDGLSTLGSSAFSGCSGFKGCTLELPAGLERVEEEAFYLCGFSKITVPASVTYVGPYGLYCGTNGGANIYFSGNAPTVTAANESKPSFSTDSSLFFEQGKTGWDDSSSYVPSIGKWNGYKLFPANEGFEEVLAHGTCGADQGGTNLRWKLYKDGRLSISGSGAMADYTYYTAAPWKDYSDSIYTVTVGTGITSIGAYSFYRCRKLTAITLPDGLTSIGASAFEDCYDLVSVTFPDSLTSIGASAFESCYDLVSVTLPEGLTSIDWAAFESCQRLTSLTFPAGLTSIGGIAFRGCIGLTSVTFPAGLTSIGWAAFESCWRLTSLTFPAGLTSINKSAFQDCSGLASITFPTGLTSINESAFQGCTGLTSLAFPDGLTSIGESAFQGCSGLTSLAFPAGLTSIGKSAFQDCTGLTSLTYPVGLPRVGEQVFSGCTGLTSIAFPTDLTSIGGGMFSGCTGLTRLTFPSGLTGIGDSAFSGCSGLTDISFPETLQSIGSEAFYLCGYSKITIPASVTYIGDYGLYCGTSGGTDIYFSGNAPTVTAANSAKPSFSTDSTLYFDLEKTGWVDSSCYDRSTGKWNGYKSSPVNEGVLAYGTCGADQDGINLLWKLHQDGSLSISGSGAMADYSDAWNQAPWKDYYKSIRAVTVGAGVTSIGSYAFYYCVNLNAITLPASLTSIGSSAFRYCSRLTSVTLPDGLTRIDSLAFQGCYDLTSITFPAGLTSIGWSAFDSCSRLTSVMFQGGLTSIGDSAFEDCTSLTSVMFQGDLSSIGDSAFQGCTALTNISLPDGLASIGNSTFQGCTALTSLTLPGGLTSIGKSAFEGCSGLTGELIIPTGLTSIGDSAFYDCAGLTGITLPDGLTSIGKSAFYGCTGLTSITLPRALTDLGTGAFARTKIAAFSSESDKFTVDKGGAVYDAYGSLRAYPAGSSQTMYAIQAGTTKIYGDMFYGAEHLVTVMVPDSVGSIGSHAFYSMAGLEAVYFAGRSPSLDSEAFDRSTAKRLKIYYDPDTTGWTEANWPSEYFERIKWNPHQATGVALDAQTLTLALGVQQKLTATVLAPAAPENTAVTWASADMDVAAVFADGTVLGKKTGTTTVTATTADGGFTASCTVTVKPAPDGVMPVRLDSVCARPGNTVQVRLMLDENPGFANLSLVIGYDADVMTLTKVENKVSGTEYTGSQTFTADPYMLTWNSVRDCTASGTLAILTFQIKNTAAYGMYPISVSFYKGLQGTYKDGVNVNYDQSRNALPLVYVGSSAEIRSYIPGDISGDGRVDSRDVLNLLRHLSGWKGITVVEEALDVNGDGESDFRDVTALLQYIAGWNVVLH